MKSKTRGWTGARFKPNLFDYSNVTLMLLLCFIMVYPLLYVLFVSVSNAAHIASGNVRYYPSGLNVNAYFFMLKSSDIPLAFLNSVYYSVGGTAVYLFINSLLAYPLLWKKFWLNKPATIYYLITMFVHGGMIPTFILYQKLGLVDNPLVMMLPGAVSVFTVMVFRTNFQALGTDLIEAAYLDGANDFYILYRLVMPLSLPILATFGLFQFVGKWNDFFTPLLYFTNRDMYPLTLVLRRLLIQANMDEVMRFFEKELNKPMWQGKEIPLQALKFASIIITIVPILFIYPFLQKYFAKGVLIGAIKG